MSPAVLLQFYKSYRGQKWTWTSLVRIGVRPTQPSTLPDTQQIHTQVASKRKLPLAKLSTPPSASRPQPPGNESKYDVLRTADTSDAKHVLPLALPTRLQPLNTESKHDAPQTTDVSSKAAPSKSVHWAFNVVSDVFSVSKLSKEEICGTIHVDNWLHFAKIRRAHEELEDQVLWESRSLSWDDF